MNAIERAELLDRAEGYHKRRQFSKVCDVVGSLDDDRNLAEPHLLYFLTVALRETGRAAEAANLIDRAIRLDPTYEQHAIFAKLRNLAGMIAIDLGDLRSAENCFSDALRLSSKLGNEELSGLALAHLGVVSDIKCDWTRALLYYQRSKTLWEKQGHHMYRGLCLHNLGITFRQLSLLEKAEQYFFDAYQIFEKFGGPGDTCLTDVERSLVLSDRGDTLVAEKTITRALEAARSSKRSHLEAVALRVKGLVMMNMSEFNEARTTLRSAFRLARVCKSRMLTAQIHEAFAKLHMRSGNPAGAKRRRRSAAMLYYQMGATVRAAQAERLMRDAPAYEMSNVQR
jgi:tetratricopeptide (TPR) repeat protein